MQFDGRGCVGLNLGLSRAGGWAQTRGGLFGIISTNRSNPNRIGFDIEECAPEKITQ